MNTRESEPYFLPQDIEKLTDEIFMCIESMGYILTHYQEYNTPEMRQAWGELARVAKDFYTGYEEMLPEAQN